MQSSARLPLILLLLVSASPLTALAERADREKPVSIESDRGWADDRNKVLVYEGRVILTQGTLRITADKLVVTQDAEGFQKGVATGGDGGLARFRQKRENKDGYMEGEAERIEYDARTEKAKLYQRAMARSGQDETRGQYIEYDGYTEQYSVNSATGGQEKVPTGRVQTIIYPKSAKKPGGEPEVPASAPKS